MLKFLRKSQPCPSMHIRSISASNPPDLLSMCLLLYPRHFMTPFLVDVTALLLPYLLHVCPQKTRNMITQQRPIAICFYHLESLNIKIHRIATHITSSLRQHTKSSLSMILVPQPNPLTQSLNLSLKLFIIKVQTPNVFNVIVLPPFQGNIPNQIHLVWCLNQIST